MALFTDGHASDVSDLRAYETDVLDLASAEGIELSAKLRVAWEEVGSELVEFLRKRTGGGQSYSSYAGPDLDQVVVTQPLRQWHTLRTLELIFQDLSGNQVSDRFERKWKDYQTRARWASTTLMSSGVGLVNQPIPQAPAPALRVIAGTTASNSYVVQVAWRTAAGASGTPGAIASILVPSTGVIGVSSSGAPSDVTGFDVYAADPSSPLTKQNVSPVPIDQEWVMPETGLVDGDAPGDGQAPDWWLRNDRILQRG